MKKRKKKKFSDIWVNQTNLGKPFGISAIAIGKQLVKLGLKKSDKKPTTKAIEERFCKSTPLKDGTPFYMWNKVKILKLLEDQGMNQLSEEDMDAFETAKNLIDLDRETEKTGVDKLFWFFVEDIPASQYERINYYLEKLGSDFRLNQ